MPVGVDDEANRLVGELTDRGNDGVGGGRVLIVHQEGAIVPKGDRQVAAAPHEQRDPVSDRYRPDHDLVLSRRGHGSANRQETTEHAQDQAQTSH